MSPLIKLDRGWILLQSLAQLVLGDCSRLCQGGITKYVSYLFCFQRFFRNENTAGAASCKGATQQDSATSHEPGLLKILCAFKMNVAVLSRRMSLYFMDVCAGNLGLARQSVPHAPAMVKRRVSI